MPALPGSWEGVLWETLVSLNGSASRPSPPPWAENSRNHSRLEPPNPTLVVGHVIPCAPGFGERGNPDQIGRVTRPTLRFMEKENHGEAPFPCPTNKLIAAIFGKE